MKKLINPWKDMPGYNCFGCSPDNEAGVKMTFYEEGDEIISFWNPGQQFQGWLNTLHGGIQSVLLDEICGWVIFRKLQVAGVTTKMETRYRKSVPTHEGEITLRAHIVEQRRNLVTVEAKLYNHAGELCTEAICNYFTFSKEKSEQEMCFRHCDVEPRISIIAAVDRKRAIGNGNKLLFWLPNDLKRFKALTTGHTVLMGRRTFESLPKGALPNRRNVVLSSDTSLQLPGAEVFASLEEAIDSCRRDEHIYIIGGASLYKQAIPLADELCLTEIDAEAPEADAFFPEIDLNEWRVMNREVHEPDEKHPYAYAFVDYQRMALACNPPASTRRRIRDCPTQTIRHRSV